MGFGTARSPATRRMNADPLVVLTRDADGRHANGNDCQLQPVFSVTKIFVAVTALRMAGPGALDLDTWASRWLAAVPPGISLRELLSHTAGLPDYGTAAEYQAAVAATPAQPWDLAEILAVGLAPPRSPHGQFRYSNTGFWLAGAILERAADADLSELLRREVIDPAGLTHTYYPQVGERLTPDGYDTRGRVRPAWSGPQPPTSTGYSARCSTARCWPPTR